HLKNYKFQGVPFSAWLYRIAMNEVNQFFRQSKNQRTISMEKSQLADIIQEVEEGKSEENIWRMVEALQELSPEEVQLIEFRYFERIPFKEIALIYGITENNAKVRVHRLLAKLKKIMTRREICQDTK
ncbi:MAG: sigma-70 family RNA polymerase sigma factor, partial [Bacteroidota bacterium]